MSCSKQNTGGPPVPLSPKMIPLKCPTCGLQWDVREDSTDTVTCPRCLAEVTTPTGAEADSERPLPVLPLEREVRRDTSSSDTGILLIIALVAAGTVPLFVLP